MAENHTEMDLNEKGCVDVNWTCGESVGVDGRKLLRNRKL
jgi:hypothetical protein